MALTQSRLRELLHYDPDTGWFTWRVQLNGRAPVGSRAGTIKKRGNREIKIDGKLYQSGRLAFFYVTGRWPKPEIDHRDGDPDHDRWSNLREASHGQNQQNKRLYRGKKRDTPKGVSWHKGIGLYVARISVDKKTIALGTFETAEEAGDAYARAAALYFGEFVRE